METAEAPSAPAAADGPPHRHDSGITRGKGNEYFDHFVQALAQQEINLPQSGNGNESKGQIQHAVPGHPLQAPFFGFDSQPTPSPAFIYLQPRPA